MLLSEPPIKVTSWTEVAGVQPLATPDDCFDAEDIVKADPEVQVCRLAPLFESLPCFAPLLLSCSPSQRPALGAEMLRRRCIRLPFAGPPLADHELMAALLVRVCLVCAAHAQGDVRHCRSGAGGMRPLVW